MSTVFSTSGNAVFTRLGEDSAAILDLGTKRYYSLNETGIRIWELIETGTPSVEIPGILAGEYEIDPETAREKVQQFIGDLLSEGLLES